MSEPLRIAIFTTMPPGLYSGGRYLAMIMACALARAGADVTYVANNTALFESDFAGDDMPDFRRIIGRDFRLPPDEMFDWLIIIPSGGHDQGYYRTALKAAQNSGARVALLNFETPNWYAALSPFPRSPLATEAWRSALRSGGLVVSIAAEGTPFAESFYRRPGIREAPPLLFGHWHPAINDIAAARVLAQPQPAGPERITAFVRTEDMHKGAHDLLNLPADLFRGRILSLIFGRGIDKDWLTELRIRTAGVPDFAIEAHERISDDAKFRILRQSRLLLFPSYFEGYGYPPIEAAFLGVPTAAYDLPVLRETVGGAATYAAPGDVAGLAAAVATILESRPVGPDVRAQMQIAPDMMSSGRQLLELLLSSGPKLPPAVEPPVRSLRIPSRPVAAREARQLSRLGGIAELTDVATRIDGTNLTLTGTIRAGEYPKGVAARLVPQLSGTTLEGATLSDIQLPPPGKSQQFCWEGYLSYWPPDGPLRIPLQLVPTDAAGQTLGNPLWIDIDAGWHQLLARPRRPVLFGGAENEVVLCADPVNLVKSANLSAALAETCNAFSAMGRPTRLLIPDTAPVPTALPPELSKSLAAGLDLLPLVDAVQCVTADAARALLNEAMEAGRPAITAGWPDATSGLELHLAGDDHTIRLYPAAAPTSPYPGSADLSPDPRRSRRSLAGRPDVILLTGRWPDPLPETMRQALREAAVRPGGCRIVVPARLAQNPRPTPIGVGLWLEPLDETALVAALLGPMSIVALEPSPGAGDPLTVALLQMLGAAPPLAWDGQSAPPPELSAGPVDGTISALIRAAIPTPEPTAFATSPAPVGPEPSLPDLAHGDALSFVTEASALAPSTALLLGWSHCDQRGAHMSGDKPALIGFVLEDAPPAGCQIELLLDRPKAAVPLRVILNGTDLGVLPQAAPGLRSTSLPVPTRTWISGENTVVIQPVREQGSEEQKKQEKQASIVLAGLCLTTPARRYRPQLVARSGLQLSRQVNTLLGSSLYAEFKANSEPCPVELKNGWSEREPTHCWSIGRYAAIEFPVPLALTGPALLTLSGMGRGDGSARMLIGVGSGLLAEMLLPAGSEAKVRILLPPASDLRLLTLEFPDLGRLPPVPDDDREMSFAIQSLEVQLLNQPQDIGGLDSRSAIVLDNMVAGSALLIGGPGPVPDARLACKGRDTLLAPTSDGRGGWVICMLIGTDEIEAQALSLRLIGPSPAALPDLATLKMAVAPPLAADVTSTPVPMRIHIETPDLTQNNLALSSRGSGRTRGRLNWVRTKTGKAPPIN